MHTETSEKYSLLFLNVYVPHDFPFPSKAFHISPIIHCVQRVYVVSQKLALIFQKILANVLNDQYQTSLKKKKSKKILTLLHNHFPVVIFVFPPLDQCNSLKDTTSVKDL